MGPQPVGEPAGNGSAETRQDRLRQQGYCVRLYVPFGREWYPYFMRRLAERPANVLFMARAVLREGRRKPRQRA